MLLGLSNERLNDLNRYIAIKCLDCKASGGIPEEYFGGDSGFPEPLSMQTKSRKSVLVILDESCPEPFVAKLSFHR
ncbi:MAG: hypothetical protein AABP62_06300 [Planctomycetota bacterium]